MRAFVLATVVALTLSVTGHAQQELEERLARIEAENRRIADELERTRNHNTQLATELKSLRAETDDLKSERLEGGYLGELETKINALAADFDTNGWSQATKSGKPIRFYGFIRLDAYYNSARASDPIIPFAVLPQDGNQTYSKHDDQFAFDSRLTRFGVDIDGGRIGNANLTGKLEMDFANFPQGSTESRETPRIRLAYIDIAWENVSLRFGQDWDVISPLYPAVHSELLLWGAGNLGDRRPMIQFIWQGGDKGGTEFKLEIAAGFQGAVDGADNDGVGGRTNIDGINSGLPHGQMRFGVAFNSWVAEERGDIGAWAYVGQLKTDTRFGNDDDFTPWAVGMDIVLPLFHAFSLRAEGWYGQALSDVRGNMLQDINTATGDEIEGWGGWAELHWQTTDTLRLALGGSIDDPRNRDLNSGVGGENREENWTLYASSKLDLGNGLFTGLDVIYWKTEYAGQANGDMVRVNWWIQLNF
ncbi:MAG: hypothetical protein KDB53_10065 [Planctomycetes bacterium]|nr:hypothetical protein [Planctomycetota bacterium]